jgi:hypothetical protein
MRHGRLILAAATVLLGGACTETDLEAARQRSETAQAAQPPGVLPPEASCRGTVLKNPYFGIDDPTPITEIPGAIPYSIPGAGGPHAIWAWRSASADTPRWERLEVPSALYLAEGQGVSQSGLKLPAGAWRLVIGASASDAGPAGLRIEFDGDKGGPFEIQATGSPTLAVGEVELPEGGDRLVLTGLGPGEVRLMMACLTPME